MSEELKEPRGENVNDAGQQKPAGKYSHLDPAELAKLKSAQKRNMVLAIIGGLVLATMGYFAGQNAKSGDDEPSSTGYSHVVDTDGIEA